MRESDAKILHNTDSKFWTKTKTKSLTFKYSSSQLSLVTTPRENSETYDEYGENPYDTYESQYNTYGEGQGPR